MSLPTAPRRGPGRPRPVTPTTILAETLGRLTTRLEASKALDAADKDELRTAYELANGLDRYLGRWSSPESADLQRLADRTAAEDWSRRPDGQSSGRLEQEMLSGHLEGQVLKMLVHLTGARRVLEIGMFTGYSALAMAEALPPDGRLVACEIDPAVAAFAQECFDGSACGARISVLVGPAQTSLDTLADDGERFDLVFIDADKAGYVDYLDAVLASGMLTPRGLVCVDNTLMQGEPWLPGESSPNGRAIADFNRSVAEDPRVEQVILPVRDGLTLIRRVEGDRHAA